MQKNAQVTARDSHSSPWGEIEGAARPSTPSIPMQHLLARNDARIAAFSHGELVSLVAHPEALDAPARERLLHCLQTWSDFFQRLLHLRAALTVDPEQQRVAVEHLAEELGHNDNLRDQRGGTHVDCTDPALQAAMHWFKHAMMVGSDFERTLLMHLVLEASGEIFFRQAAAVFHDMPYFHEHSQDDGDHAAYGVDLLRRAPATLMPALEQSLEAGWDMMTLLCDRMAQLSRG